MSKNNSTLTTLSLVKNEDRFVYYALCAWEPYAAQMLVWNNHSTDQTEKIIRLIKSPKITYQSVEANSGLELTKARNLMLEKVKTDWFLLLDGDEVWGQQTINNFLKFLAIQPPSVWAIALRTKNAIGDIYHYLPDSTGRYQILGRKGHLTIHAYRLRSGFSWKGEYPEEYYADEKGRSINHQNNHLAFFEGSYFHYTNLTRSSVSRSAPGHQQVLWEKGVAISPNQLPEIFFAPKPPDVPEVLTKRTITFELLSSVASPLKMLKRKLKK